MLQHTATFSYREGVDRFIKHDSLEEQERAEVIEMLGYEMNTAKLTKAIFQDVLRAGERVEDYDLLFY